MMCNGTIYYPVYDEEKDTFSVYKMDPATGDRKKIEDNLKTGDLYCSNGKLFFPMKRIFTGLTTGQCTLQKAMKTTFVMIWISCCNMLTPMKVHAT